MYLSQFGGGVQVEAEQPFDDEPVDPEAGMEPEEVASEAALAVAERFLAAIHAGDSRKMWDLFSEQAQAFILNKGHERGMAFDLTSRLRTGEASNDEMNEFTSDVLAGIQSDLRGIDFTRLAFDSKAEPEAPLQVRVNYLVQVGPQIQDLATAIPAGSMVMRLQDDEWRVERLIPRPGGDASPPKSGNGLGGSS